MLFLFVSLKKCVVWKEIFINVHKYFALFSVLTMVSHQVRHDKLLHNRIMLLRNAYVCALIR